MSVDKVQTIQDWPEPRKVKNIQSFLGFTNFYRRFIYNYSDITVPLTWLTRKGTPWVFTEECRESFNFQAVASGGHDTTVQLLLEKGADVNAQGGKHGSALQAAALRGHDTTVRLLLLE
jgi:Ankyrin repeats (many copies)